MRKRRKAPTDLMLLEEMAAAGHKQREIAAALGITYATLGQRLHHHADVREAFDRGRARRVGSGTPAPPAPPPPPAGASPEQLVVDAVRREARTFGKMLALTRLEHPALVNTVQDMMRRRVIYARSVAGERQHFLAGEVSP